MRMNKIWICVFLLMLCVIGIRNDVSAQEYAIDVMLEGGSGKATISSPTLLMMEDGKYYAEITWSSPYYDYMLVDGVKYENLADGEMNSTFRIPVVSLDVPMEVLADTTAMGTSHEISYRLTFFSDSIASKDKLPQEQAKKVIWIALGIIVIGGMLNTIVKKKRRV